MAESAWFVSTKSIDSEHLSVRWRLQRAITYSGQSFLHSRRLRSRCPPAQPRQPHHRLCAFIQTPILCSPFQQHSGAPQPDPPRTLRPRRPHRCAGQQLPHTVQTLAEDPDTCSTGSRSLPRPSSSRSSPDRPVEQRAPRLVTVGDPMVGSRPAPIPDHVHVAPNPNEAVRAAIRQQAAHDSHNSITFRGHGLCPRGGLAVNDHGPRRARDSLLARSSTAWSTRSPDSPADGLLPQRRSTPQCLPTIERGERSTPRAHSRHRAVSNGCQSTIFRCSTPPTGLDGYQSRPR